MKEIIITLEHFTMTLPEEIRAIAMGYTEGEQIDMLSTDILLFVGKILDDVRNEGIASVKERIGL